MQKKINAELFKAPELNAFGKNVIVVNLAVSEQPRKQSKDLKLVMALNTVCKMMYLFITLI